MNNTTLHNTDVQRFAETCTKTVLDISAEKETVLSFVSQDSHKKKIELISAAEDMTTVEKLEAITKRRIAVYRIYEAALKLVRILCGTGTYWCFLV